MTTKPLAIFYEHPDWFSPLFSELERRGIPYERVLAHTHRFDPGETDVPYSLVFNRVSPSSYLRDHTSAIFYALQYLQHVENLGTPTVNGYRAHLHEVSKARQLGLLKRLDIPHPRSLVVNATGQIEAAAAELEYPVIVKPNIGGSGALMQVFQTPDELRDAVGGGLLDGVFVLDATAIVQEYHPPVDGAITRVEALGGQILYAIRITNDPSLGFDLCPADLPIGSGSHDVPGSEFDNCPVDAAPSRSVVATQAPDEVQDAVLAIFDAAGIDIGGVEYLVSERDGGIYLYDVNAVSNFVANAPQVVGFDPFARVVDYLEGRLAQVSRKPAFAAADD
jgi:glutathione synthase/RimK-type ligase-like ATP-grasp enzyme